MNISINVNKTGGFDKTVGCNPGGDKEKEGRKSLFAGDIGLTNDPIELRKKMAQKQALKIVQDAWDNDRSVEQSVEDRRGHYEQMKALKEEAEQEVESLRSQESTLQEQYGVKDDSKEQQDLELLKKYQDYKNGVSTTPLSEEEMEAVAEINKQPLTEYQQRALELNDRAAIFKGQIQDASSAMKDDVKDVKRILLEKLKSDPMLDAMETVDEIWDVANKDIMGMAVQDAMEHIEEQQEEAEEKAEKTAEKQEEKEEQLEELQEKRAIEEAMIEGTKEAIERAEAQHRRNETDDIEMDELLDVTKMTKQSSEVKSGLSEIKASMKLLEADLKGIEVDEKV